MVWNMRVLLVQRGMMCLIRGFFTLIIYWIKKQLFVRTHAFPLWGYRGYIIIIISSSIVLPLSLLLSSCSWNNIVFVIFTNSYNGLCCPFDVHSTVIY